MSEAPRHESRHRPLGEVFEGSNAIVDLLAQHRIVVAPHVAARLGLGLGGDAGAIVEVAAALRGSQRLGLTSLPDPLPLVPTIDAAIGPAGEGLIPWERQALVIAAVCIDDRIDVLLAATGRSMAGPRRERTEPASPARCGALRIRRPAHTRLGARACVVGRSHSGA